MKTFLIFCLFTALAMSCNQPSQQIIAASKNDSRKLDRTVLPIKEPTPQTYTELDARNATPPQPFEVKAPLGAPNVVIVLLDDIGFGAASTFGGPCNMPT